MLVEVSARPVLATPMAGTWTSGADRPTRPPAAASARTASTQSRRDLAAGTPYSLPLFLCAVALCLGNRAFAVLFARRRPASNSHGHNLVTGFIEPWLDSPALRGWNSPLRLNRALSQINAGPAPNMLGA